MEKSWLALWMAHQISTGQPIWDFQTHQGTVLYLCLEDPLDRVQRRLVDVTGGETGNILIATEAELIGNGFEGQMVHVLSENPDIDFVLIDTLQKIRDMKSEGYSYSGDYNTMTVLKNLADRFGVCIVLIHHTRKEPSSDPFDMVSGTTGLMGCADSTFVLLKENRLSNTATLDATGRDIEDLHLDLMFNEDTMCWMVIHSSLTEEKVPKHHELLSLIQQFVTEKKMCKGTATMLISELSALDKGFSCAPNALTRILNSKSRILRGLYNVSCVTGHKSCGDRIISLRLIETVDVLPADNRVDKDGKDDKKGTPPPIDPIVPALLEASA